MEANQFLFEEQDLRKQWAVRIFKGIAIFYSIIAAISLCLIASGNLRWPTFVDTLFSVLIYWLCYRGAENQKPGWKNAVLFLAGFYGLINLSRIIGMLSSDTGEYGCGGILAIVLLVLNLVALFLVIKMPPKNEAEGEAQPGWTLSLAAAYLLIILNVEAYSLVGLISVLVRRPADVQRLPMAITILAVIGIAVALWIVIARKTRLRFIPYLVFSFYAYAFYKGIYGNPLIMVFLCAGAFLAMKDLRQWRSSPQLSHLLSAVEQRENTQFINMNS